MERKLEIIKKVKNEERKESPSLKIEQKEKSIQKNKGIADTIKHYEKILEKNPMDEESLIALAYLYRNDKEKKEKTLEYLEKVLKFFPNHPKIKVMKKWKDELEKKVAGKR